MAYYGGRNNRKTFLRAMIEPSIWSSSDDLDGCITTAYSFSRDAQWLIENFCKFPISDLSSCLASKVSSEFCFKGQKWKLQVWLNYENEYIELNLLRKGPSSGNVDIAFGLKSVEGKVKTFERMKYNMDLPCNDWTSAVRSRSLLRSRLYKEMESLEKGLFVYCMMGLVEVPTCSWDSTLLDKANYFDSKPANETASDINVKTEDEKRQIPFFKVDSKSENETANDENVKNNSVERKFTSPKADSKPDNETASDENVKNKSEERKFASPKALVTLSQNLKDLYLSRKGCDVNIKVKSESFSAHRAILSARTPVLAAMLPENAVESETEIVCVEDCDPKAFKIFLMFVYTGTAENLSTDNVMSVYYLANKYDLPELKDECVQCMMSSLTIDNICDVLCLASSHDEKSLMKATTEFFEKNANDISQTPKWEDFIVKNSCIVNTLSLDAIETK